MIPATKTARFAAWFSRDAERRLRRSFAAIRVRGLEEVQAALGDRPLLIVSNHTAWWDPLVAIFVCHRVLGGDAYAMMDGKNLARLSFFARVGAFGVDLDDPRDGARAIRYAAKLLAAPATARRIVWIFAQGREVPITVRPLGFRRGAAEIGRLAPNAAIVPVAVRYEMGARPEPTLWIALGAPAVAEGTRRGRRDGASAASLEEAVTCELDRIERAVAGDDAAFRSLHDKREGRVFTWLQRALAWWTRPKALKSAGAHHASTRTR